MKRFLILAALLGLSLRFALTEAPLQMPAAASPAPPVAPATSPGGDTVLLPAFLNETTGYDDPFDTGYNCRYGTAAWGAERAGRLAVFGGGWFVSFTHKVDDRPSEIEYVPMLRMKQDRDNSGARLPSVTFTPSLTDAGLGQLIDNLPPGSLWLIGNEPDRINVQDDTMPDVYAHAYHEAYQFIKARDPSARIGIAGLVQVTPARLQYLDIAWDTYLQAYGEPMPVDVWNMHVYILPEMKADGSHSRAAIALGTDPALAILENETGLPLVCPDDQVYCYAEHDSMTIFAQQVREMRQWMKVRGEQQKPLIITEYSTLYPYMLDNPQDPSQCFLKDENGSCFTPERVSAYMIDTFNFLEHARDPELGYALDGNRLVQQWLWFAMHDYADSSNKLIENDFHTLTLMGQTFREHVTGSPRAINLRFEQVWGGAGNTPGNPGGAPLHARLRNVGNLDLRYHPFTVSFYADAALTQEIASGVVDAALGCAREEIVVSATWDGLTTPGVHPFWVRLDSGDAIPESSEVDNVGSAQVMIDPGQQFLPAFSLGSPFVGP